MSLYAEYIKEIHGKIVIETDNIFICYSIDKEFFYLEDIYLRPEVRNMGLAKETMEMLIEIAKENKCTKLLGSITLSSKYKDENMMKFLNYGFSLYSVGNNVIFLIKDI
jgi:GNAT superfamily N-acetyltransferase